MGYAVLQPGDGCWAEIQRRDFGTFGNKEFHKTHLLIGEKLKHTLKVSENDLVFTIVTEGDGDVEGIMAFLKDIISHPQWKPGKHILLDHRALKIDGISVSGIDAVASYFVSISDKLGDGKIALVMNRDIDFGIARAWESITNIDVDIKIHVFRKLEEAKFWLKNNSIR